MCQQVWCVYIAQVWKFSALCSFGIWHNGTRVNLRPWIFLALFEKNCLFSFFAKVVPTSTMCVHSSSLKVFSSFFLWHLAQWNQSQFNTRFMTNSTLVCTFDQNSVIKMTWWAHGGFSKIFFLDHFSSSFLARNAKISPIFHFDRVHQSLICHIPCVKTMDIFVTFWEKLPFFVFCIDFNTQLKSLT